MAMLVILNGKIYFKIRETRKVKRKKDSVKSKDCMYQTTVMCAGGAAVGNAIKAETEIAIKPEDEASDKKVGYPRTLKWICCKNVFIYKSRLVTSMLEVKYNGKVP